MALISLRGMTFVMSVIRRNRLTQRIRGLRGMTFVTGVILLPVPTVSEV